jgi:hypothetical protein
MLSVVTLSFKISHYIYTPPYIPEKTSRTSPLVSLNLIAGQILFLDFVLCFSLLIPHFFRSCSPMLSCTLISHFALLIVLHSSLLVLHYCTHCKNSFYLNSLIIGRVTRPLAPLSPQHSSILFLVYFIDIDTASITPL